MKTKSIAVGAASLLLFAVAACDDGEDPEVAFCRIAGVTHRCRRRAEFTDANSAVDDYNAAVDKVGDAVTEVKDNAGDLAEEQVDA